MPQTPLWSGYCIGHRGDGSGTTLPKVKSSPTTSPQTPLLWCKAIHSTLDRILPEQEETVSFSRWHQIFRSRCPFRRPSTILVPLLFLAFINNLLESTRNSDARLFADDCLLYRHIASSNDSALLQQDLTALERWEETWQMTFHPAKCTVIKISTNRRQIINTSYQLHGHTLEVPRLTRH